MRLKEILLLVTENLRLELKSSEFRDVFKNYLTYFGGLILIGAINFFSIPAIIRLYGTGSYGEFSLVQNVILIAISFTSGWLNQCIIRFNDRSRTFSFTIHLLLAFSLIPTFLILLIYHIYSGFNTLVFFISLLTLLLGSFFSIRITFYQSEFRSRRSVGTDLIRVITFVAFIFLFYLFSVPNSILLAFLISYVAPVLFIIFKDSGNIPGMLRRRERHGFINQSSGKFKIFLSYGIPLTFWFVASSLIGVFSRYVMDYHLPISDVGYYSAVYDMTSKGCQLVFTPFLAAGYPLISKLYNEGQRMKSYNVIRNLVLIELAIAVPLGLGLYYLTGFYLESIIGVSVYSFSRRLVMIIFAGSFLWQLAMLLHKPLELRLRTRQMLLSVIISLVMNIVLAVIFIPKYGMIAGGYATLAGVIVYILLTLLMVTINRRTGTFSDDSRPDRTF